MFFGHLDEKKGLIPLKPTVNKVDHFEGGAAICSGPSGEGLIDEHYNFLTEMNYEDIRKVSDGIVCVEKEGRKGLIDRTGKEITPLQFRTVSEFHDGLALVTFENKTYAFIDKTGKIILGPYESAEEFSEGLAAVKVEGKYGFIDREGTFLIPPMFDMARKFKNGVSEIQLSSEYPSKCGLSNRNGKVILEPLYDWIEVKDYGIVVKKDGKYALADASGKMLTDPIYDDFKGCDYFLDGYTYTVKNLARMVLNGKEGLIDTVSGKIIAEPQYEEISETYDGTARVLVDHKWGFIDTSSGEMLIPPRFSRTFGFEEDGLATVEIYDIKHLVDKTGKLFGGEDCDKAERLVTGKVYLLECNGTKRLVDRDGKVIVESLSYINADNTYEAAGKYGWISENGTVVPPRFDLVVKFGLPFGGVIQVELDGKWGIADEKGDYIFTPQFDEISTELAGGYLIVTVNGKKGVVHKTGTTLIEPQFDEIHVFSPDRRTQYNRYPDGDEIVVRGWLKVEKDGKLCIADRKGESIVRGAYRDMHYPSCGLMAVADKKGKWGFIDMKGKTVIPPQFEDVRDFSKCTAGVKLNGKWGLIDRTGKMIMEPQCDDCKGSVHPDSELTVFKSGDKWGLVNAKGKWALKPKLYYLETVTYPAVVAQTKKGSEWDYEHAVETMERVSFESIEPYTFE